MDCNRCLLLKINFTSMKKIVSLVLFALIVTGCDDGDLKVDTINFDKAAVESCTNGIIYKLNENESILLDIPESAIIDEPSDSGKPALYQIDNSAFRVIYRAYNGTVSKNTICDIIPPAAPTVTEQWTATGGIMEILTTAIKTVNATDNSSRITGYNHNISFKNITFLKPTGPQVYAEFPFGDYKTTFEPLPFTFNEKAEQCSVSKQVYNWKNNASIVIDGIDPTLLTNEATPPGSPRTGIIGSSSNKLVYTVYNDFLSDEYFCQTPASSTPTVRETWNGVKGVAGVSGTIEVKTESFGPDTFKHTITLKNATLQKGNNTFRLGDNFVVGELILAK